jgi:MoaA/NifB/PqqE/SkfB family radical SAM enzyme
VELTGWGEFFFHKKWENILEYVYSINNSNDLIQINTNGTLLNANVASSLSNHLRRLTISINAANENTYNRDMKNADFNTTINNIRQFMANLSDNDKSKVVIHFVAHTDNYEEIPELVELANSLSVKHVSIGNYYINSAEREQYALFNIKHEYNNMVDRAKCIASDYGINFTANKFCDNAALASAKLCNDPFYFCYVATNGDTAPCCYTGKVNMGNVFDKTFEDVWFGDTYQHLREARYLPECKICSRFVSFDDPAAHQTGHFKRKHYNSLG